MSGRSTRSSLSTSIRRRPLRRVAREHALISDDLPVPRAPVSSTLLAGRPATNWRVLRSIALLLRVDGDQIVSAIDMRMRDRLQVAAALALAPARGGHLLPVGVGDGRRQQRLDARQHLFGARDQLSFTFCPVTVSYR